MFIFRVVLPVHSYEKLTKKYQHAKKHGFRKTLRITLFKKKRLRNATRKNLKKLCSAERVAFFLPIPSHHRLAPAKAPETPYDTRVRESIGPQEKKKSGLLALLAGPILCHSVTLSRTTFLWHLHPVRRFLWHLQVGSR